MSRVHSTIALLWFLLIQCDSSIEPATKEKIKDVPAFLIGHFEDDYSIRYAVSDSAFILLPSSIYHIKKWSLQEQFLIAQNDSLNAYDPGLWSRIDWIELENMGDFTWAFCLSVYDAESADEAVASAKINPESPKTGCNGFPFSRMMRIEPTDSLRFSY